MEEASSCQEERGDGEGGEGRRGHRVRPKQHGCRVKALLYSRVTPVTVQHFEGYETNPSRRAMRD